MYIPRTIEADIRSHLFQGKILIIYGSRQVGKTTVVKHILGDVGKPYRYLNCDEPDVRTLFRQAGTSTQLKEIIGDNQLTVIDEAQRVKDIGIKLKLLVDNFPENQVIATGSSSFELANEIIEPLTGRHFEFWLYPLSLKELFPDRDRLQLNRKLESLLLFGSYPAVCLASSIEEKITLVKQLASDYLYKDILKFQNLKNSEVVQKLLQALALQVGQEVSYTELAALIGVSKQTIASYIDLLEKVFIVFPLHPFSRNLRKEIGKMRKICFYDVGVRNAILNNFNPFVIRSDTGAIWENFVIVERRKRYSGPVHEPNSYFWRTYDGQEIDLVEEKDGQLSGYEIKWGKPRRNAPKAWRENYPGASWRATTRENYFDFLT